MKTLGRWKSNHRDGPGHERGGKWPKEISRAC
nr:MAG TPA: hypothetical protein [Caudoviricetes sp.]DAQ59220.1 MAG TPA: hypothetical protein [Caudoviricetes sp.]